MDYKGRYEEWLHSKYMDEETKEELLSIKDNEKEIEDRFYRDLEFGTAGLRGKIGVGTNRMNKYIVARATQGLADFIIEKGKKYMDRGVVIAYDCRHFSKEFAKKTALVLAGNGIKAYLFEDLRPTPELSFAVRKLNTAAGIVITASHNPKEYNGYKVYWEEGSQILEDVASAITTKIQNIKDFSVIKTMDEKDAVKRGLLSILGKEIDDVYIENVKSLGLRENIDKEIKIVYTPLNGTGNIPVRRVLKERGFKNIIVVPEQENPDPDFTTVGYPNPEDVKAFAYAEKLGKKVGAEILIATDPDCDRLGVMVKGEKEEYVSLNGNQMGAIFIQYILEAKKEQNTLQEDAYIVKSIVTGDLGKAIAKSYGVKTFEALTGFKNICGKVNELEKLGNNNFVFGYEESIGYVAGNFVRDKDGVIASELLCEAAAYYKGHGKTLLDVLEEIYKKYGYYQEKLVSIVLEGIEGQNRIKRMMEKFRTEYPTDIKKSKLSKYIDYQKQVSFDFLKEKEESIEIPISNVLKFVFDDHSWYAIRPSGTEPKIKVYMYTKGDTLEEAQEKLKNIEEVVMKQLEEVE
ncbi:phospho-sugar mutase [Crassaminicella thermophila]|uniref:Phosphoglucomutase n=1 Tax=Crassaminicella thermophila TaxID=2599308 RepID=A0A5C0SBS2_CRATE|nr:phospho-sugar mutase [Crassaminicella thermophila]QEK11367.1 phospho-sugar mutase [Crassaminicella thermophila]